MPQVEAKKKRKVGRESLTSWVEVMVEPSARARVNSGMMLPIWCPTVASPKGRPWARAWVVLVGGGVSAEQARVRAARVKRARREAGAVRVGVLVGVPMRIF